MAEAILFGGALPANRRRIGRELPRRKVGGERLSWGIILSPIPHLPQFGSLAGRFGFGNRKEAKGSLRVKPKKSQCISSEEKAGETHRGRGPGGGEGPTGRGNEKSSGSRKSQSVVGKGQKKILTDYPDGGSADEEGASYGGDVAI